MGQSPGRPTFCLAQIYATSLIEAANDVETPKDAHSAKTSTAAFSSLIALYIDRCAFSAHRLFVFCGAQLVPRSKRSDIKRGIRFLDGLGAEAEAVFRHPF